INGNTITLSQGSSVVTEPTTLPCPPTDGLVHAPEEPLAAFIGENPNGTWTLHIDDVVDFDGGSLDAWGVEVCTGSGCTLYPSSDVPKTIPSFGSVESTVNVSATDPITKVSVIDLRGTHTFISDLVFHLISPAATDVTLIKNICGDLQNFDVDL